MLGPTRLMRQQGGGTCAGLVVLVASALAAHDTMSMCNLSAAATTACHTTCLTLSQCSIHMCDVPLLRSGLVMRTVVAAAARVRYTGRCLCWSTRTKLEWPVAPPGQRKSTPTAQHMHLRRPVGGSVLVVMLFGACWCRGVARHIDVVLIIIIVYIHTCANAGESSSMMPLMSRPYLEAACCPALLKVAVKPGCRAR